ncbi:MAG: hypothetical protein QGF07_01725 [Phycisphaerales bacterium]|nr:hypothetical protein [Phycisphaerales bacterium]
MSKCLVMFILLLIVVAPKDAAATSRKTPWLYETRTMAKGEVEYEQWLTLKTNKKSDSRYEEFRFRHEIEWGVTDEFQLAFYMADWRHKRTSSEERTFFHDVAIEAIYQLQTPNPDQMGSALYGEIKYGSEFLELEGKLLLELEFDQINLLYNFTIEAEWEGQDFDEDKGKIENSFAITYQPKPSITLGLQALWEIEFPDWSQQGDDVVSIGPSLSYQSEGWWISVSPLFQVTNIDSEPDLQIRMLFGIDF